MCTFCQKQIFDHFNTGLCIHCLAKLRAIFRMGPELLRELKSAIFYIETYGGNVTASFAAGGNLEHVKRVIAEAEKEKE